MAKQDVNRQPLPAGTVIEYSGEEATVVQDIGGERIDVEVDGSRQRWWWTFEGVSCSVISHPSQSHPAA